MKHPKAKPPAWVERLLERYGPADSLEEVLGDLRELYAYWLQTEGPAEARRRYLLNVLRLLRPWEKKPTDYSTPHHSRMLRNYLKIAGRNLFRHKVTSGINILGLAVGMAVAMLIGLWVHDELSFNQYHQHYDRIAQVKANALYEGKVYTIDSHPIPLAGELRASYGSDFTYVVMATGTQSHRIGFGDQTFTQSGRYMQPDAPSLLTLQMLKGTASGMEEVNAILLSESVANKLFGRVDPIHQVIRMDNKRDVKVTGVYADLPHNSEFKDLTFIAPFEQYVASEEWVRSAQSDWSNQSVQLYVQLAPQVDFDAVSDKIRDAKVRHVSGEQAARKPVLFLHPMGRWHLYAKFENGVTVTSDALMNVWLYGIIGGFVLLLAGINFMNLSTARASTRAKEVGVRKVVGSSRIYLINQFFSESIMVAFLAFGLSIGLVWLLLPWFNQVADKQVTLLWANPQFWLASLSFVFLTGLLAGSYPALYLSSFDPIQVLKGTFRIGRSAVVARRALVVVQFTISMALMIGTIVVYRQIHLAKNRPIGYNRHALLNLPKNGLPVRSAVLRNELLRTGVVEEVAESSSPLTSIWSTSSDIDWAGKAASLRMEFGTIAVTPEFGRTIGWQFVEGRDFSGSGASDSLGLIINQAAAQVMNLKSGAVGESIQYGGKAYKLLGIVKDMVMESPYKSAYPTLFFLGSGMNCILIRIKPTVMAHRALPEIGAIFNRLYPEATFDYQFVDQEFAKKFGNEERISQLTSFFAGLTILVSCLGLFGLSAFTAEQRTKEIGVRKVLGASVLDVWGLLSKEFVGLVLVAFLIATPVAWLLLSGWLENYEYRTQLAWWIFAAVGIGALVLTLLTASIHSLKVALMNPVKSLRTE